jgi:hypothetical protein
MSAEAELFEQLSTHADIIALVGSPVEVYAVRLPEGHHQQPNVGDFAITYTRITDIERAYSMTSKCQKVRSIFRISAWGLTAEAARALASRVRKALDNFRGTAIEYTQIHQQREQFEAGELMHQVIIEIEVVHNESEE